MGPRFCRGLAAGPPCVGRLYASHSAHALATQIVQCKPSRDFLLEAWKVALVKRESFIVFLGNNRILQATRVRFESEQGKVMQLERTHLLFRGDTLALEAPEIFRYPKLTIMLPAVQTVALPPAFTRPSWRGTAVGCGTVRT